MLTRAILLTSSLNKLTDTAGRGKVGYGFKPSVGDAVMFDSMVPGTNTPVLETWHAGCNVIKGTKIILQKFKELPMAQRKKEHASYRQTEYRPYTQR